MFAKTIEENRLNKKITTREIPISWSIMELGEVSEVISGQSPDGKFYNDTGEGMPFYQGKTEFTEKYIGTPKKWTTQTTKIAKKNDILISVRAPVGPVNVSANRICIGRGLAAIRGYLGKINQDYLFYLLKKKQPEISGNAGAIFASIKKKDIERIKILLPPLFEQKKIATILMKIQQTVENKKKLISITEELKKSMMEYLFTYGTTREKTKKTEIGEMPISLNIVSLGEVCESVNGGTPSKNNSEYWANGTVKWISARHIGDDGKVIGYKLISKKSIEESSTKIAPRKSTVIITRVSVGKFCFLMGYMPFSKA